MVRNWLPLIAFVASAAPAGAADITLHVPVRIVNVPSATDFVLYCNVFTPGRSVAGAIPVSRTVTGGAFSETITVEVGPVIPPYTTLTYICHIMLNGNSVPSVSAYKWQAANDPSLAEALPRFALQRVKLSTMTVTGPVPTR